MCSGCLIHPTAIKTLHEIFTIIILISQVSPDKIHLIIGSGGKKVKSIIEETGVDSIETQDDGTVSRHVLLVNS